MTQRKRKTITSLFDIECQVATSLPQFEVKATFWAGSPKQMVERLSQLFNELAHIEVEEEKKS